MAIKQRAMSDEQKQVRRQTILDVALDLFQETSYEAVSMADVARRAGLAKGTLYLYFSTKEMLFLAIQTQMFEAWFDEVDGRLAEIKAAGEHCTVEAFVDLIAGALENRPVMVRLIAILHTILEQNIDFDTALAFKQMLRARVLETGPLVEACLPFLKAGEGTRLLLQLHALIIGLQHMADPAPVVRQVLEEPGLEIFKIDFMQQFSSTLTVLLNGLAYQHQQLGSIIHDTDELI